MQGTILSIRMRHAVGESTRFLSPDYLDILDSVVRATLAVVCVEEDPRKMCYGNITNNVTYGCSGVTIQWMVDGEALDVQDHKDLKTFLTNLDMVPLNTHLVDNELSVGREVCKHPSLNVWWRCGDVNDMTPLMDGIYVNTTWELDQETVTQCRLKMCKCVERHEGLYVYHIPHSLTLYDILYHGKYVALLVGAIKTHYPAMDVGVIDYTVERWNKYELVYDGDIDLSMTDKCVGLTYKQGLQLRSYLSKQEKKSLMIQEFDGTFTVIYVKGECVVNVCNSAFSRYLVDVGDERCDDRALGWKSGGGYLGFF